MSRQPLNQQEAQLVAAVRERTSSPTVIDEALLRYRAAVVVSPRDSERLLRLVADAIVGPPKVLKGRALEMQRALYG